MPRIYVATKLHHAAQFRKLRLAWNSIGLHIISRWLDMEHVETGATGALPDDDYKLFWLIDEADVRSCDVVLVYGEPKDNLRGALVEAGIGIGCGKLILAVGENENFGTWQHHPQVIRIATLEHAKTMLKNLYMEYLT